MCTSLAEPDLSGIPRSEFSNYEPQANKKFFDPAIFQKCWRGVGEQPTFAEQIRLANKTQQKSKRESQRIAIAFSIEMNVPNYEPQATKKFFDPTIFQKCWRGVGEQPTFAKQIRPVNETTTKIQERTAKNRNCLLN